MEEKLYIKGHYRKSIFSSDKGYVIGLFKVRETNDDKMKDFINKTVTFTGYFYDLNEDDSYLLYGELINHPRYGMQYQVTEYERVRPENKEGVQEFLASDLFPGIGDKMAEKIVEVLGKEALNKILEDASCLMLVPNLSQKKANQIHDQLVKYEESHKTIVTLTEMGFSMKDSLTIYGYYKSRTLQILEQNMYQMIEYVEEISFLKVDKLRQQMEIQDLDQRRVKACLLYIMGDLTWKCGDTYLEKKEILKQTNFYLKADIEEDLETYLLELEEEEKIVVENDCYYLANIYQAEKRVIQKLTYLITKPLKQHKKLNDLLEHLETSLKMTYHPKQKEAIIGALQNNILLITGGPGTGKTTIIKAIVELYQQLHKYDYDDLVEHLALLAPTGRASKRMSESTLLPSMTIHRFLKWNKETNQFSINAENKDNSSFIIIDEMSMIDLFLFDSLLEGLTNHIQLILVGDYHQLPSVGPGQVLKDLIESNAIPTIELDYLYRQDENSYITTLAHEIKENALSDSYLKTKNDYTFLTCRKEAIRENLKYLCNKVLEKGYDYKRVQIMAPMYKGENGIDLLNQELQAVFNPPDLEKRELTYGDLIFREQDKILQLVNMPDNGVYNGDIGVLSNIIPAEKSESKKNEIYVDYDGNIVKYLPKDFASIKHGYVISIHKSQGSEFELVILPITSEYYRMLYRKLIYTAITRAKRKLILLGEPSAFVNAVKNDNEYIRKTNLALKLQKVSIKTENIHTI